MNSQASAPVIPNPYNQILSQKHGQMQRAVRFASATICDVATGQPQISAAALRRQLKTIPINATLTGDNILIPALAGVKQIFEIFAWNVGAQTVFFQQGTTGSGQSIPLLNLVDFTALSAVVLGFNGNFDMPHWEIDNNQPLVVVLGAGTQLTGFIRYRVQNGTN